MFINDICVLGSRLCGKKTVGETLKQITVWQGDRQVNYVTTESSVPGKPWSCENPAVASPPAQEIKEGFLEEMSTSRISIESMLAFIPIHNSY